MARHSDASPPRPPRVAWREAAIAGTLLLVSVPLSGQNCRRNLEADVIALDQMIVYNRFGAHDPAAMMFALASDVVSSSGSGGALSAGNVRLRPGKRPRPLTLRMNVGDCLQINFTNLLDPTPRDNQPATRSASVHVMGMNLVNGIAGDGSNVGTNPSSLVAPGGRATYIVHAEREGTYLLYSTAQTTGGDGNGGTLARGLFGAVNVEPAGAEWYRSQLSAEEMQLATTGSTPAGQPILDYDAVYPAGHPRAGLPILKMLDAGRIVSGDLTAIITGPGRGPFPAGTYPKVTESPDREQPFREFTIIFHDEIGIKQAFPEVFEHPEFQFTLHGGRDGFAINYATGGAGAEILANRFGVGPSAECAECKFEESFLSSWVQGDPSMVVDVPADASHRSPRDPQSGLPTLRATRAYFPDDPSNVYHSYLNDHVKIRNLHAGPKEHHIFHLHAHQWLHTPDSDLSTYLDSQSLGPGSGFTYDITYGGAGNRNHTPGDAIFHCHFYPHFAQGMWAIWRNHDVLETGTVLDADGRPAAGTRALPDGEIAAGTPIPGLVPIPGNVLPPMPTPAFAGFPFYIPGRAGHRPPRPPLDMARNEQGEVLHGGLPRHVVTAGTAVVPELNTTDFSKRSLTLQAEQLPEDGTAAEAAAMAFHAAAGHASYRVDGNGNATAGQFVTNGKAPIGGAPFADPCYAYGGRDQVRTRVYKTASFQVDAKYNKAGWHFPQHRMYALWADVQPTLSGARAPEPMFLRVNTYDCVEFHQVNLLPMEYAQDDFQVRTPTDILGQHIHLVKFDVTSSDGSANGFNYEDGALAPGEVRERIEAINAVGGMLEPTSGQRETLEAKAHPYFGSGPGGDWVGAQETLQRWYTDDVLYAAGSSTRDRGLRTIFTHDHYSPSTQQQGGTYAALVGEPAGSSWRDPETGELYGSRTLDGGPTSWRADILTTPADSSYREFVLAIADFVPAYEQDNRGIPDPEKAINPPGRFEVGLPYLLRPPVAGHCPNGTPAPCPEIISLEDPGTMLVNYRNEPIALRVRDPATNRQAAGLAGDLSHAFRSNIVRADTRLNSQPTFYPARPGAQPGDPFTPLLRAYEGDLVQIRMAVGAQEEGHNVSVHGLVWNFETEDRNSGVRNSQMMGISEHFEFKVPPMLNNTVIGVVGKTTDYLYRVGSATEDLWNGTWGILRSYAREQQDIRHLPNNPRSDLSLRNLLRYNGICPRVGSPARTFDVSAVLARDALPGGTLVYNSRTDNGGPLHDPTAILYVRTGDLDASGKLKPGVPVEPLVLRANRRDCIYVTLRNRLPADAAQMPELEGFNTLPPIVDQFNANQVRPSNHVGLHPQLVAVEVAKDDGANVGFNRVQTVAPGQSRTYQWFAGTHFLFGDSLSTVSHEFGATNLLPSDPIKHSHKGAIAALIIEPQGSIHQADAGMRASASIRRSNGSLLFREHVLLFQNDVNLRFGSAFTPPAFTDPETGEVVTRSFAAGEAVPNQSGAEDAEDSGQKAFNYRTEPFWFRLGFAPDMPLSLTRDIEMSGVLSNQQVGGADPQTPVFTSGVGNPTRFRVLQPGGHARNHTFQVHGHAWQELPYQNASTELGDNPLSEWKGSQAGHGPTNHFDVLLRHGAGGYFGVPGDYLVRDQASFGFDGGLWAIFRVLAR